MYFLKNLGKKLCWTQIQTLDPPDPKGLGPDPKFLDPTDPGSDLGPIKKLGSGSGSCWTRPRSDHAHPYQLGLKLDFAIQFHCNATGQWTLAKLCLLVGQLTVIETNPRDFYGNYVWNSEYYPLQL